MIRIGKLSAPANGAVEDSEKDGKAEEGGKLDLHRELKIIGERLRHLQPKTDAYATEFVDRLLGFADKIGTSDVHLQPTVKGFDVRFRMDGVLQHLGEFPLGASSSIVSRLKVLSSLLTYRSDIPQEGRIAVSQSVAEIRVSTFPTLYGERAVLRFFGRSGSLQEIEQLGHTPEVNQALYDTLAETSGAMIVSGPAGSGKSTTLFACLRHLAKTTGGLRSLISIEDPIEVPIAGVAQSQVNVAAGFDLHTGLRSLLRQDPEVIMIGEIRDPLTAEIAIQACLTGQLMLTTYHADSTATSISRLLDMGIQPYLLRSGVIGILNQRLLRSLCQCSVESSQRQDFCALPIDRARLAKGCELCHGSGYQGRVVASEFLSLKESVLADQMLDTKDSRAIYRIAVDHGMKSLWERATELVRQGITSPQEVRRVLGVSMRI
jgi:type II secretory ATPase GspE/PulE/Tfp pilus assembly ATPase PilB-like protein